MLYHFIETFPTGTGGPRSFGITKANISLPPSAWTHRTTLYVWVPQAHQDDCGAVVSNGKMAAGPRNDQALSAGQGDGNLSLGEDGGKRSFKSKKPPGGGFDLIFSSAYSVLGE